MTDAERYDALVDEVERRCEQIDDLNDEVELLRERIFTLEKENSEYEGFARWMAWWCCREDDDSMNVFSELALRKLNKLGVVGLDEENWWVFDFDDEEEWFKERCE